MADNRACSVCGNHFQLSHSIGRPITRCASCTHLRRCAQCGLVGGSESFHRNGRTGLASWCSSCKAKRAREPDVADRRRQWQRSYNASGRRHDRELRARYGLSLDEYERLLLSQGGCCAICSSSDAGGRGRFHVDHDHNTGAIRGLLCHHCNTGLGAFADDTERLIAAATYLEKSWLAS